MSVYLKSLRSCHQWKDHKEWCKSLFRTKFFNYIQTSPVDQAMSLLQEENHMLFTKVWMPVLAPYPASLLFDWEPAPFTRYPSKCHSQVISRTNHSQIRLQFGCDKAIEEQCIILSQLGSHRTKDFTVDGLHCKTDCVWAVAAEIGLSVQVTTCLVQESLRFPLVRLSVHKHYLLPRSFQTGR